MDEDSLRKQVNASGLPFQHRVAHEVGSSVHEHRWEPVALEHRWQNQEAGTGGFIDIVLRKEWNDCQHYYMVVECKRLRGGSWVFLTHSDSDSAQKTHALIEKRRVQPVKPNWIELDAKPQSAVSSFCVVPGQSDRDTPMIERIADVLFDSLESLADEVSSTRPSACPPGEQYINAYVPVIVTNVELMLCTYEPADVDLAEGILKPEAGRFRRVPSVRFQKTFSTTYSTGKTPMSIKEADKENTRTVFVVHAPSLSEFLRQFDFS